ncbi:nuclear transport factor 2 family protein [Nguyenibacter sp. L1]|uniref:nuclear transport factor 2 family protein n=1 Tax=Nguyenibacter sp. L1 TaxID=3049350 RepID=UPI002B46EFB6|nr:nuclear transport factor 2 family protein [Nguyenibacter sp. L1]WRH89383.1 nuclear transport factor 2 family protein [Nguyenibacter sp. L1]
MTAHYAPLTAVLGPIGATTLKTAHALIASGKARDKIILEEFCMNTALDIVRRWYATGDVSLLAPHIEWKVLETFPAGGTYNGRDDIAERFFPAVKSQFAVYETRPQRFVADGETVVSTGIYHVQGKSGRTADIAFAHIWTVQDGQIAAFQQIADTAAMQDVLGR